MSHQSESTTQHIEPGKEDVESWPGEVSPGLALLQMPDPLFALIHSIAEPAAFFGNLLLFDIHGLKHVSQQWQYSKHRWNVVADVDRSGEIPKSTCDFSHGFIPGPCKHTAPPNATWDSRRDLRYCDKHVQYFGYPAAVCSHHRDGFLSVSKQRIKLVCWNCAARLRLTQPGMYNLGKRAPRIDGNWVCK